MYKRKRILDNSILYECPKISENYRRFVAGFHAFRAKLKHEIQNIAFFMILKFLFQNLSCLIFNIHKILSSISFDKVTDDFLSQWRVKFQQESSHQRLSTGRIQLNFPFFFVINKSSFYCSAQSRSAPELSNAHKKT